jgi:hypothetical protein
MRDLFSRIRPQIMVVVIALAAIGLYALTIAPEVTIGCLTGLVGISGKILEKD